jgi:hypothetical protein
MLTAQPSAPRTDASPKPNIAALLILAGWALTIAVVAGLTRLLNR